jgi:hypothetical protein
MSPDGLHEWVVGYNWDDGLAPIRVIVDSPATEFATALLIYWRLDGPWLAASASGVNAEAERLQDTVRGRLQRDADQSPTPKGLDRAAGDRAPSGQPMIHSRPCIPGCAARPRALRSRPFGATGRECESP